MSEALEFEVFTLFPAAIEAFVGAGLMAKAIERGLVVVRCTDLREFTHDRHRTVDDAPFGGGAGMVIKPEPVADAIDAVVAERGPMHTILLTPSGPRFDQRAAERLSGKRRIALLCGRYEGIDDRIREHFVDECLSIGDFVLNGGEVAAAAIIEAVGRLREGVLGNPESAAEESFASAADLAEPGSNDSHAANVWRPGLVLEHPHYTRPANFRGHEIPPVLRGGDHQAVELWRRRTACLRTWALRPELRPRWQLPAGHPIVLAVPSTVAAPPLGELAELAASFGAALVRLGGPRSPGPGLHMRDLKQLRRALRKRHARQPWVLGAGLLAAGEIERSPRLILDVLAYAANHAPPPLIVWCPGEPSAEPVDAWLALRSEGPSDPCDRSDRQRLAIGLALIDISQPQMARSPIAPTARAAFATMRAEALLPAAGNQETSS